MRQPRKVTLKHARTTGWCLYKSPITPRSLLLQPTLDGRQRDRCNSWRVSHKKTRSSHAKHEKVQFTYCTPDISASTATTRRPERALRNNHSTSAHFTAHLTLKTRKCSSRTANPDISARRPEKTVNFCSLLSSRSHRRPTLPLSATLQPKPVPDSASVCSTIPGEPHPELRSSARSSGHRTRRVASLSLSGVSYLPQRLGPAASTKMTDVDFLGHLLRTCGTSSPIPLPRRPCRRLGKRHANSGAVDERAQRTFLTFTKCQLAHSFLDGRVLVNSFGIFNLLCSGKQSKTVSTRLSPPFAPSTGQARNPPTQRTTLTASSVLSRPLWQRNHLMCAMATRLGCLH